MMENKFSMGKNGKKQYYYAFSRQCI